MHKFLEITEIRGREIIDSRGNPTVLAEVELLDGTTGCACVPSGASTGKYEAVELRDGTDRFFKQGVENAVTNIETVINKGLKGVKVTRQEMLDKLMLTLDETPNKSNLGANAMLGVSLAIADAAAKKYEMPLYRYIGGINGKTLPIPMMNILNGGKHADNTVDFQEFMIMPIGAPNFKEGLRMCCEVYQCLKKLLVKKGMSTGVGDEGGFAPNLKDAVEVLTFICEAVKIAGYETGKDISIAIDAAASELYDSNLKRYVFPGESKVLEKGVARDADEMIDYYEKLVNHFPIISLEDGLDEEDWEGWKKLTKRLGDKIMLVGDDLFVTNTERLQKGIDEGCANAILIKPNQIGTLTETMNAIKLAKDNGYKTIMSHRSGETEDTIIADLSVGLNTGFIKTGAPCRGERTAKYNRLLKIQEEIQ
ncbi:MAG: phosphopyruvate hydratase [Lachnospiraceae bacterium]|nr:phosphopyruvate hydratase [Lachnospiraceae bacterium]